MGYGIVSDNITNGKYKVTLEYPERLEKPRMPSFNVTPAMAREYADKLEEYEKNKVAIDEAKRAYNAEVHRLEQVVFREDLEAEYGTKDHKLAQKLWDKAWEHGHSDGLNNVLYWYDEFAEFIIL